MTHVTYPEFRAAGLAIINAAGPEDTYYTRTQSSRESTCRYVFGGEAGCIIGQILAECGVPIEVLSKMDPPHALGGMAFAQPPREPWPSDVERYLSANGFTFDPKCFVVGKEAQSRQDVGDTWHSLRPLFTVH